MGAQNPPEAKKGYDMARFTCLRLENQENEETWAPKMELSQHMYRVYSGVRCFRHLLYPLIQKGPVVDLDLEPTSTPSRPRSARSRWRLRGGTRTQKKTTAVAP